MPRRRNKQVLLRIGERRCDADLRRFRLRRDAQPVREKPELLHRTRHCRIQRVAMQDSIGLLSRARTGSDAPWPDRAQAHDHSR